jgi:hypothetical protein
VAWLATACRLHRYIAITVTDSLPYRYAHYHDPDGIPGQPDLARMGRVVKGMIALPVTFVKVRCIRRPTPLRSVAYNADVACWSGGWKNQ